MKKHILLIAVIMAVFTLAGCGKKALLDDCGCYLNFEDAKKAADKSGKDILVIISSNGDDYSSKDFIDDTLMTQEFDEVVGSKYEVFHADFSQVAYQRTAAAENATKAEKQQADTYANLMQTAYEFAMILDVQYTPSFFLLTKDGYVISEVEYEDEIFDPEDFLNLLEEYDEDAANIKELVAATAKGSKLDKVVAIDKLFNATDKRYQTLVYDLAKRIPDLDPDNKSGLISPYILIKAETEAIPLYTSNKLQEAIQCYLKAVANPHLTPAGAQEAYFMCAYLLASSGIDDNAMVVSYLTSALTADENGVLVPQIQEALNYYTNITQSILDIVGENSDGTSYANPQDEYDLQLNQ